MAEHRITAFLTEHDVTGDLVTLDPTPMSDGAVLMRIAESRAVAEDITDQLRLDAAAVLQRGVGWRARAYRARRFYVAEANGLTAEMTRRQHAASRQVKIAIAARAAEADETQDALFVQYMRQSVGKEEFTALWARVRAAFPDAAAWQNGKGAEA